MHRSPHTVAFELFESLFPNTTMYYTGMNLSGPEWTAFLAFMGDRDGFLLYGDMGRRLTGKHAEIAKRIVKSKDRAGRIVTALMDPKTLALTKVFVAGMDYLPRRKGHHGYMFGPERLSEFPRCYRKNNTIVVRHY